MTPNVYRTYHQAQFVQAIGNFANGKKFDLPMSVSTESFKRRGTDRIYNDGVMWDNVRKRFMMYGKHNLVVFSKDGIEWRNRTATNLSFQKRDTASFLIDPFETDPKKRFKAMAWDFHTVRHFTSPDGIIWLEFNANGRATTVSKGSTKDSTTMHLNPFRKKWMYSVKENYVGMIRSQMYHEVNYAEFGQPHFGFGHCPAISIYRGNNRLREIEGNKKTLAERIDGKFNTLDHSRAFGCTMEKWARDLYPHGVTPDLPFFITADASDKKFQNDPLDKISEPDYYLKKRQTDVYMSTILAYESIMFGWLNVHTKWNSMAPKIITIHAAWSRDGFHFDRVPGEQRDLEGGFLNYSSRSTDNRKCSQQLSINGMLVMNDSVRIYTDCFTTTNDWKDEIDRDTTRRTYSKLVDEMHIWDIRRDGFVSLNVDASKGQIGVITTESMVFQTNKELGLHYLYINVKASKDSKIRVKLEVSSCTEQKSTFLPIWSNWIDRDSTKHRVTWPTLDSLSTFDKIPIVLTFEMNSGASLFSFWIGPRHGESGGWVNTMKV